MFFGPKVDLTPQAFRELFEREGGKVIDCRTAGEAAGGMISGAVNVDWLAGEMHQASSSWDKNEPVYCYCRSGARSGAAVQFLKQQGFTRVYNLGGYSNLR